MTNLEMVEALREKASVSYEEAKNALEQSNWDMLDAILLLEKEGKVNLSGGSYSTKPEEEAPEGKPRRHREARNAFRWLGKTFRKLVGIGNANSLVVSRKGEKLFSLPVTAFAILLICLFKYLAVAMIVGLFCGLRYSFQGPNLGKQSINNVMDHAASVAENVKEEFRTHVSATEEEEQAQKDGEDEANE